MKTNITILTLITILSVSQLFSQKKTENVDYRRSSLNMVLIESAEFDNKDKVMKSWNNYVIPDKYNDHSVEVGSMDPTKYDVSAAEKKEDEMPLRIDEYIIETDLARKLVAKWFNVTANGMDMKLVQERGFYNATEMDAALASGQARGLASLGDAGKELISKTFVTFSKLNFVPNEIAAKVILNAAIIAANKIPIPGASQSARVAADLAYDKAKEGYSVWTNTWLYQLDWNDSIASEFWNVWNKKEAFDNADFFKLKYIGKKSSSSLVTFSLKKGEGQRTEEQIIDLATVRNIDNVFGKLQKEYDAFKPAIPVLSTGPIMAQIGLKEGIEAGDKFEVLEMNWDSKTGTTAWKKIGVCSVDKKLPIWDNRYAPGMDKVEQKDEDGKVVNATTFSGSKKIQVGMLLKQLK